MGGQCLGARNEDQKSEQTAAGTAAESTPGCRPCHGACCRAFSFEVPVFILPSFLNVLLWKIAKYKSRMV